ncbi:MAG TPA: serine protease [Pseudogracilibacillus sp.]|nr:serine protease [Pseudogracilibacillus sp.]
MREDDREDKQNHDLKSETNDYNETEAYKIARAAYEEKSRDVIDRDLYEKFEDEELYDLVEEARAEALKKSTEREREKKSRRKVPKFFYWLIALVMLLNIAALLPQTLSIPAVDFLMTSAELSKQEDIKTYKQSVVVIETTDSKGTGFAMNEDGDIMTNYHVIEGYNKVTVAFPNQGLYVGEVVATYPEIDLAVLELDTDDSLPYLPLADNFQLQQEENIYFIGNPLKFHGIANKGVILDYTFVQSKSLPVVMMDAPVYRGNSGSPVINHAGEVIGVVYATLNHKEEGRVGLFIPIDYYYETKRP